MYESAHGFWIDVAGGAFQDVQPMSGQENKRQNYLSRIRKQFVPRDLFRNKYFRFMYFICCQLCEDTNGNVSQQYTHDRWWHAETQTDSNVIRNLAVILK